MDKPKAIIYCRCSPRPQDDTTSLAVQEDKCREWCQEAGYEVAGVYVDSKSSGAKRDRPKFELALKAVKEVGGMLVAYDLSRISRSTRDVLVLVDELNNEGATVATTQEPWINGTTPTGRMLLSFMSSINQYFREHHSQKTREALEERRKSNVAANYRLAFGQYLTGEIDDRGRRKLGMDPLCERVALWVAWRHQNGWSLAAMARELECRGYPYLVNKATTEKEWTPRWDRQTIRRIVMKYADGKATPVELDAYDVAVNRAIADGTWEFKHWDDSGGYQRTRKAPLLLHRAMVPNHRGAWPHRETQALARLGVDLQNLAGVPAINEDGRLVLTPEEIRPLQIQATAAAWRAAELDELLWPEARVPSSIADVPETMLVDGHTADWEADPLNRLI